MTYISKQDHQRQDWVRIDSYGQTSHETKTIWWGVEESVEEEGTLTGVLVRSRSWGRQAAVSCHFCPQGPPNQQKLKFRAAALKAHCGLSNLESYFCSHQWSEVIVMDWILYSYIFWGGLYFPEFSIFCYLYSTCHSYWLHFRLWFKVKLLPKLRWKRNFFTVDLP